MKRLAIVALAAIPALVASCTTHCDCAGPVVGLVVMTAAPITQLALSGSACAGAHFRCIPADFDNTIRPDCTDLQIAPKTTGECVVDLTAGGTNTRIQHRMRVYPACCGDGEGFIGDEDRVGVVDLRHPPEAGDGGLDGTVD